MRLAFLVLPLAVAACDARTSEKDAKDVHIGIASQDGGDNKVSVNVPGFNANLNLPDLNLGGHMNLDGVKLAPDSHVTGVDVLGDDKTTEGGADGHGSVRVAFTNADAPAKLLDYYRRALADAGFTPGGQSGGGALTATRDKKEFALALAPDGSGSRGTITITGN